MSRRMRLQIKPNINPSLRPSTGTTTAEVGQEQQQTTIFAQPQQHPSENENVPKVSASNVEDSNVAAIPTTIVENASFENLHMTPVNLSATNQRELIDKEDTNDSVANGSFNENLHRVETSAYSSAPDVSVEKCPLTAGEDFQQPSFDSVDFLEPPSNSSANNKDDKTPVLMSLLTSPSKYRSRFQVRPNLHSTTFGSSVDSSVRRYANFDESDMTSSGPIVGASTLITQKIGDVNQSKFSKRRFDPSQQLDRSLFTMADLIYWNPEKGSAMSKDPLLDEQNPSTSLFQFAKPEKAANFQSAKKEEIAAPQVRVNADGSIVVDETSLTLHQTKADLSVFETVRETSRTKNAKLNYASFRRNPKLKTKMWTKKETDKFYRYLKMVGTNFQLMVEFFPKRHRDQLKNKYRRECKYNPQLIDEALMGGGSIPAPVPKCLLRLRQSIDGEIVEEFDRESEDDENDDDDKSVASHVTTTDSVISDQHMDTSNAADNYLAHSNSESEEDVKTMFAKPTRFGRQPKPVKLPEPGDLPRSYFYRGTGVRGRRRKNFVAKVIDGLRNPKQDPLVHVSPDLVTPGPGTFPKYVPFASRPPVTPQQPLVPGFGPDAQQHLLATDSPGQQLLLVHEKSKEPGKPDLVHVYLVSSPSTGQPSLARPSVDLHIPNVTGGDYVQEDAPSTSSASAGHQAIINVVNDVGGISAEHKINLTISGNQPMEVDLVDDGQDVVLIDI